MIFVFLLRDKTWRDFRFLFNCPAKSEMWTTCSSPGHHALFIPSLELLILKQEQFILGRLRASPHHIFSANLLAPGERETDGTIRVHAAKRWATSDREQMQPWRDGAALCRERLSRVLAKSPHEWKDGAGKARTVKKVKPGIQDYRGRYRKIGREMRREVKVIFKELG